MCTPGNGRGQAALQGGRHFGIAACNYDRAEVVTSSSDPVSARLATLRRHRPAPKVKSCTIDFSKLLARRKIRAQKYGAILDIMEKAAQDFKKPGQLHGSFSRSIFSLRHGLQPRVQEGARPPVR